MSAFVDKNRNLLDTFAITNSDLFPLGAGINKARAIPVVETAITRGRPGSADNIVTINEVHTAPAEEVIQHKPEVVEMWNSLEALSSRRPGCAGFTAVFLFCGPIVRLLPVMVSADFRMFPPKPIADLKGWKDILNQAASNGFDGL